MLADASGAGGQRTALVTGASGGIGRAVAAELYHRNLRVVLTARNGQAARAAAAGIGSGARWGTLDITDAAAVEVAVGQFGPVDVLVCNAGVLLDAGTDPLSVPLSLVD